MPYTAGIINKSITGLTLTGQYAVANDVEHLGDANVYHLEANYIIPMNGFKLGFDAMYRASTTDFTSDKRLDGSYLGGRISISELAGFGFSFAAGKSDKNDDLLAGLGNGADSTYTGSILTATHTYARNTDSYAGKISYDFSKIGVTGLSALVQYGWTDQGNTNATTKGTDYTNIAGGLTYAIPALKGLTTSLQYETQEREAKQTSVKADTDELWFKAGYKF